MSISDESDSSINSNDIDRNLVNEIIGVKSPGKEKNEIKKNDAEKIKNVRNNTNADNVDNNVTNPDEACTNSDKGPYFVMLEKDNIDELAAGKFLSAQRIKSIEEITKMGKNLIRVKCNLHQRQTFY